jgi:endoplasmic reticulum Man9GlcNAc2 1,2-alpha-mannosidase
MSSIHKSLINKSLGPKNLTYTVESVPQPKRRGYVDWYDVHRMDESACYIGGELMLGAVNVHSLDKTSKVSVPPKEGELSAQGWKDWNRGLELIETCVDFWKGTKTSVCSRLLYLSLVLT